jgi:hypothetical protein
LEETCVEKISYDAHIDFLDKSKLDKSVEGFSED